MKRVFHSWMVGIMLAALSFAGAPAAMAGNSQQEKMKTCNADASKQNLKGDARKDFMSKCLSGKTPAAEHAAAQPKGNSQQEKMKTCNAEAGKQSLKGDARKDFMSKCLSSSAK